jgi:hypothetical protein
LEHETPPKYKAGMAICSLKQFFHLTVGWEHKYNMVIVIVLLAESWHYRPKGKISDAFT